MMLSSWVALTLGQQMQILVSVRGLEEITLGLLWQQKATILFYSKAQQLRLSEAVLQQLHLQLGEDKGIRSNCPP